MAKTHVDKGSPTCLDFMSKYPVAKWVPRSVKDATQSWSVGDADTMGEDESVGSGGEELKEPKRKYAKRGSGRALFRQATVDEVIWFPLDNAPELMQELAHESGARWAVHGTPASGVGIVGLLRAGLTVFAITRDEDHADELYTCVLRRVSEEMCTSGKLLADPVCMEKLRDLQPKQNKKESFGGGAGSDPEEEEEEASHDTGSSSLDTASDTSEKKKKKPTKKPTKKKPTPDKKKHSKKQQNNKKQ